MKRLTALALIVLLNGLNGAYATEQGSIATVSECTKPLGFRAQEHRDPSSGPFDFLDKYNP